MKKIIYLFAFLLYSCTEQTQVEPKLIEHYVVTDSKSIQILVELKSPEVKKIIVTAIHASGRYYQEFDIVQQQAVSLKIKTPDSKVAYRVDVYRYNGQSKSYDGQQTW